MDSNSGHKNTMRPRWRQASLKPYLIFAPHGLPGKRRRAPVIHVVLARGRLGPAPQLHIRSVADVLKPDLVVFTVKGPEPPGRSDEVVPV